VFRSISRNSTRRLWNRLKKKEWKKGIEKIKGKEYSLEKICREYGYSRQGYYKRIKKDEKMVEIRKKVKDLVIEERTVQPKVGGKKLYVEIKRQGEEIGIGRDKFFEILGELGLLVKRKRSYRKTTNSNHRFNRSKNLIKFKESFKPKEVVVADITYIDTMEGFSYLSLITDIGSRKILGYYLSKSLAVEGCLKALKMATKELKGAKEVIHHSDRGVQYCCNAYINYLEKKKIKSSMTEEDHVYENAIAERVNGILKDEFLLGEKLASHEVAKKMVKEAIKIYNGKRLHMSLNYKTPNEVFVA
jgi:putative transposase